MIVEKRELSKRNKKDKSEFEIIKKQAGLNEKKRINDEKELTKQARLEEKIRIKEEKELAKQARLEEKIIIKEMKESSNKKNMKTTNSSSDPEIPSAKATHASLPETIIMPFNKFSTDTSSSNIINIEE